jgi:hypothetical protein
MHLYQQRSLRLGDPMAQIKELSLVEVTVYYHRFVKPTSTLLPGGGLFLHEVDRAGHHVALGGNMREKHPRVSPTFFS